MRPRLRRLRAALLAVASASRQDPSVQRATIQVGPLLRSYAVQVPAGEAPAAGWPLVLSFHGFMGSAEQMASYDHFRQFGAQTAIVVHGDGYSDPTNPGFLPASSWQSWHGAGSAGAEEGGADGPTCRPEVVRDGEWQCYASCRARGLCTGSGQGADRCRWTHCEDDVAFALAVVEHLKSAHPVDGARVYASGHSNGALFAHELAADPRSAGVFAAIAPVSGLPHNGFNRGTLNPGMRLLDVGGALDTYVYHFPNVKRDASKSYGPCCGWFYSSWRNTTALWASQKGLEPGAMGKLGTAQPGFSCQGWSGDGTAERAEVAVCFYRGGHHSPEGAFQLVWSFLGIATSPATTSRTLAVARRAA